MKVEKQDVNSIDEGSPNWRAFYFSVRECS